MKHLFRSLVLGALALTAIPAFAAATFYWRVEGTTLSSTLDLSPDTSATGNGGVSISTTGVKYGTNGMVTTDQNDYYIFTPTSLCNAAEGTLAGWVQFKTAIPASGNAVIASCHNTTTTSRAQISMGSSEEPRLTLQATTGTQISLVTTSCNFVVDTWYFVVASYHIANDDRTIACYTSSGTLINSASDLATDLAAAAPTSFDEFRVGTPSSHTSPLWVDNVFVADTYGFAFENYSSITTFIPTFTSGPADGTFAQTTLSFTYTPDQDGTAFAAACADGQTIATGPNTESGTCSGGAAIGTGNDAASAGVSNTVTITGLSAGTQYDVYIVYKSGLGGYSTVSSQANKNTAAAEVAPSAFDSSSCSALDTDTYRCAVDAGANTLTIKYCVLKKDVTTPADGAAVVTCTGGIASGSVSATGSSQNIDIDIPGGDPFPLYDIHLAGKNVTLYTAAVSSKFDITLTEPTGRQYLAVVGAPGVGEVGVLDGASPAAVDGDIMDVSETSDSFTLGAQAHVITLHANTTFDIATGGDGSRQLLTRRFYDVSAAAWSDAFAGTLAINDVSPNFVGSITQLYEKDATLSESLDSMWQDFEGDALSHSITNNPAGGSVTASETLTGAYTTCGSYTNPSFIATDTYAEATSQTVTINVGVVVPDVLGALAVTGDATIQALCSLVATQISTERSATVPLGYIISTDPIAGELVLYNSTVNYVVSSGPPLSDAGQGNKMRMSAPRGMRIY